MKAFLDNGRLRLPIFASFRQNVCFMRLRSRVSQR